MRRSPRLLAVAWTLVLASCASGPPEWIYPRAPALAVSETPTALPVTWLGGYALVDTYVDGRGPWKFLLDSGADHYGIDLRAAEDLQLEREGGDGVRLTNLLSGTQTDLLGSVRIREIRAGPLVESDTGAEIVDLSLAEQALGTRIDGVLPASAFREGLLTFDFAAGSVTVEQGELPAPNGQDVLALSLEPLPWIAVELGGSPCAVILDTGSQSALCVPAAREPSLRFRAPPAAVGMHGTLAGVVPDRSGRLDGSLAWGRHRIADPVVSLTPGEYGLAGVRLLGEFRVTFDFAHERVRFERSGSEPIRSKAIRGIGAGFLRRDGVSVVEYVFDGGPAARAGLRVGDRVEAVDDRPVGELTSAARERLWDERDKVKLRVAGADGPRDIVVPVVTVVE